MRKCAHPGCNTLLGDEQHGNARYCAEHRKIKYNNLRHREKVETHRASPPVFIEERCCEGCSDKFLARVPAQRYCNVMCWEGYTRGKRSVDRHGQVDVEKSNG